LACLGVASTAAMRAGQYEIMNIAGAALIVAVSNALDRRDFPFAFGTSGATAQASPCHWSSGWKPDCASLSEPAWPALGCISKERRSSLATHHRRRATTMFTSSTAPPVAMQQQRRN
jgi:hypothetical protein